MASSLCSESVEEVRSGGMEHTVLMYTTHPHTHSHSPTHSHHPPQLPHTSLALQNYTSDSTSAVNTTTGQDSLTS